MHSSQISAKKWVVAIHYALMGRKSVSRSQLSKEIGTTQTSARFMLQRISRTYDQGVFKLSDIAETP